MAAARATTTPKAWRAAQPPKTASGGTHANHGAARLLSRPATEDRI
nr:hypothetical protein [Actinoplanes polyasparticus]